MATCGGTAGGSIVNYIINNTAGDAVFVIRQETVNGPGETQRNSDLTLYGYKAPNWGEKFNENFYRLLENFAAPSQREVYSTPPDDINFAFSHNRPATEDDLGTSSDPLDGFGINNPVHGQFWFNTSATKLYIYDAITDNWRLIGPCCTQDECGFGGSYECSLLGECGFGGSDECGTENPCFGFGGAADHSCSGGGSAGLDVLFLNDLQDVATSGSLDGQVLTYNSGTGVWGPSTITTPSIPPIPDELSDLNDADTTGAILNDVLTFTGAGWFPQALPAGSAVSELTDLSDVDTTTAVSGNTLVFDGIDWLPSVGPFDPNTHLTFLYNNVTGINETLFDILSQTGSNYETVEFDDIHTSFNALPFAGPSPYEILEVPTGVSFMKFKGNIRFGLDPDDTFIGDLPFTSVQIGIVRNPISAGLTDILGSTEPWITGNTVAINGLPDASSGWQAPLTFETQWIPVAPTDNFAMYILCYSTLAGITLRIFRDGTSLMVEHR